MKVILFLVLFISISPFLQVQGQMLFEHTDRTYLSRDVVYEFNRQVTTAGFLDVHVLRVPLNDPLISVAPVESRAGVGVRETTQGMLATAGAIAGVNADFFGMAGTHTAAMGPVIANGNLVSITQLYNVQSNEFATFILDNNDIPFLHYLRPQIMLLIGGLQRMPINSINRVPNLNYPVIITNAVMHDTSQLVARFPEMWQVLIASGRVISVTSGQPVGVPADGFVIVMNAESVATYMPFTWIGLDAEYMVFTNFDRQINEIQAAVGGGGLILRNGQVVHDSGTAIAGRHPRTALGITPDRQTLILMVVDGRGRSIGATHEEMATLLLRNGASEAMHFDGGGSSTMVAQPFGRNTALQVVNTVSDPSQRAVINALGIFDRSSPGAIAELILSPEETNIQPGQPLTLSVTGRDLYRHNIPINQANVQFSAEIIFSDGTRQPATGTWFGAGNIYMPNQPGSLYVTATYGEFSISRMFFVQAIANPTNVEDDSLRTEMTNVIPGFSHDFELFVPATGNFSYSSRAESTALVLQMSAAGGGIFAADRNQWALFSQTITGFAPNSVVIHMDTNPLRMNSAEFSLFHAALRSHADLNRTIFVISNREHEPSFQFRDGIRYIDLGANEDVTMNFRVIDRQIWYDF